MSLKNIFTQDTLNCSLFQLKICALHRRSFQKDRLFTTFLPLFTVDEVCNISNKYRSPENVWTHSYFYTRDFITLLHLEDSLKYISFFTKAIGAFCHWFLEASTLRCTIFIILHKWPYIAPSFSKKISALHCRGPQKHYWFWEWVRYLILQINASFLISQQKTWMESASCFSKWRRHIKCLV